MGEADVLSYSECRYCILLNVIGWIGYRRTEWMRVGYLVHHFVQVLLAFSLIKPKLCSFPSPLTFPCWGRKHSWAFILESRWLGWLLPAVLCSSRLQGQTWLKGSLAFLPPMLYLFFLSFCFLISKVQCRKDIYRNWIQLDWALW